VVANPPLDPPPFRSPVNEIHHIGSVLPGKPQKFARIQVFRFGAKKSLKPPA
jgi:hypothetical protein